MKLITVNANEVALVTKRGKILYVLYEGRHWVFWGRKVTIYPITKPIVIDDNWQVLLESEALQDVVEVVEINDNEIGIELKDELYSRVYAPCKVMYWNGAVKYRVIKVDITNPKVSADIPNYILQKPAVAQYLKVYPVESYQRALLLIDGKLIEELGPGIYYYWKSDKAVVVKAIDTRIQSLAVSGQEILTKDKAAIRINMNAQYKVTDIIKALVESKDYDEQIYSALQLQLRAYIGSMTLDQLLATKEAVGEYVSVSVKEALEILGVQLLSCGIKDIILPGDVKDIMNQVLIAQKKAQANTIMRQEETASTRSLLNTAKLLEENTMLMKLKEMEYMEKIADKIGEITVNGGSQVMDQLKTLMLGK